MARSLHTILAIPDPAYMTLLNNKRILIDVGTLLRGILFHQSHSSNLLMHVEMSPNCTAIISPHIRDKALEVLERTLPHQKQYFASELLSRIKRKYLDVVPDGDPRILPAKVRYDPDDDDIVIATAVSSNCDILATLDAELADRASQLIEIVPPSDLESSTMYRFDSQEALTKSCVYAGPTEGSIALEFILSKAVFGYASRQGTRRYIFHTDKAFGLWINDKSWKCQIGFIDVSDPIYTFPKVNLDIYTMISIGYECTKGFLCVGLYQEKSGKEPLIWRTNHFPADIFGNKFRLGAPSDKDMLPMHVGGILSTRKTVEEKETKYSLIHKSHFEPLDCQRFPLKDSIIQQALMITPEKNIARKVEACLY